MQVENNRDQIDCYQNVRTKVMFSPIKNPFYFSFSINIMNYLHGLRMLITIMKIGSWLKAIDLSSIPPIITTFKMLHDFFSLPFG